MHKSNEIILKYIDRKSLEIAVKEQGHGCLQDLPLGRAFGRNLQPHKWYKGEIEKSFGPEPLFQPFLGALHP